MVRALLIGTALAMLPGIACGQEMAVADVHPSFADIGTEFAPSENYQFSEATYSSGLEFAHAERVAPSISLTEEPNRTERFEISLPFGEWGGFRVEGVQVRVKSPEGIYPRPRSYRGYGIRAVTHF